MMGWLSRNRLTSAGLLLVLATAGTALFGVEHVFRGTPATILLIALATFKGVAIILEFMELRTAPMAWRTLPLVWTATVSAILLTSFLFAPS